jgi:hypothetical protein
MQSELFSPKLYRDVKAVHAIMVEELWARKGDAMAQIGQDDDPPRFAYDSGSTRISGKIAGGAHSISKKKAGWPRAT